MHPWTAAVAALLIFVILWDAFQTIILSRRVSRKFRPTRAFYRVLWTPWRAAAKRVPQGNRRENLLTGFGVDMYMSGTTFFTLGLGDVTPRTALARGLAVFESGIGFAFLALVIGYVPLISQAFSRREVSISMLDASAGS